MGAGEQAEYADRFSGEFEAIINDNIQGAFDKDRFDRLMDSIRGAMQEGFTTDNIPRKYRVFAERRGSAF